MPKSTVQNPFAGVEDSTPQSPILPQRPLAPGETVVFLRGCTLAHYKLMATGVGFDVHFTVPLNQKDKLPDLTDALQRMVDIDITRYDKASDPLRA